ncbi:hypothetical protein FRC03_005515 [Tulasnella sp. 419]|nr:hypothetical protein FRC03_005515 [Tulasnella sp. 419]
MSAFPYSTFGYGFRVDFEDDEIIPDSEEEREVSEALQLETHEAISSYHDWEDHLGLHATTDSHEASDYGMNRGGRRVVTFADTIIKHSPPSENYFTQTQKEINGERRANISPPDLVRPTTQGLHKNPASSPRYNACSRSPERPEIQDLHSSKQESPPTPRRLKVEVVIPSPQRPALTATGQARQSTGRVSRHPKISSLKKRHSSGKGDVAVVNRQGILVRTISKKDLKTLHHHTSGGGFM